jgi:DNA-binding transcriptional MerR regulator
VEEADRIQLISIVSKLSAAEDAIELARVPLKAAQDARKKIIGLGKSAGFTAKELTARLDEMNQPSHKMAEQAARERRQRLWLGIIEPDQSALLLGDTAPQEAKDETDWRMRGYRHGLQGRMARLPEGIPTRMDQPWLAGHADGFAAYTAALEGRSPTVAQQAADDFKADEPEVDVAAAAKKLAKDPAFMARTPDPDSGFEATPEELAAQKPRQAAKDRREAGEAAGEVV